MHPGLEKHRILLNLIKNDFWGEELMERRLFKDEHKVLTKQEKEITIALCNNRSASAIQKSFKITKDSFKRTKSHIKHVFRTGTQWDSQFKKWIKREKWKELQNVLHEKKSA